MNAESVTPDPTSDLDPEEAMAELERLRDRILAVDAALIQTLAERQELVMQIGRAKAALGLPVLDPSREAQVVRRVVAHARTVGLEEETIRDVMWRIIASARNAQGER
ncbi:MAG: chorismate mutase [Gemmatimonadota bacterium]